MTPRINRAHDALSEALEDPARDARAIRRAGIRMCAALIAAQSTHRAVRVEDCAAARSCADGVRIAAASLDPDRGQGDPWGTYKTLRWMLDDAKRVRRVFGPTFGGAA